LNPSACKVNELITYLQQRRLCGRDPAKRRSEPALIIRVLVPGNDWWSLRRPGSNNRFVLVERALRRANHHRGKLALEKPHRPTRIHWVRMQPIAGRSLADIDIGHPNIRQGVMTWDPGLRELQTVRATTS